MKLGITFKVILFIVGTLVLVQLVFFNVVQSLNLTGGKQEDIRLRQEISELAAAKPLLQEQLAALQDRYGKVVASVPGEILDGYEDPEQVLAGFFDYIKASESDGVETKTTLKGERKYINRPVPVFEHDMTFDFSFKNLSDAREFLSLILGQEYYPLVVHNFALRNSGQQKIIGTMDVSLIIPARQQSPLVDIRGEER